MRYLLLLSSVLSLLAASAPAQVSMESPTRVVVRVNGDPIYAREVQMAAQQIAQEMLASGQGLDGELIGKAAVEKLVDGRLLVQEAERRQLVADETQVRAAVKRAEAEAGGTEALREKLAEQGMDLERLRRITRETIMVDRLREQLGENIRIDEAQVAAFYESNRDRFKQPEQVKVRQLLVRVDAEATAQEKKKARAEAEALRQRAVAGGDFATLVREYSAAPSAAEGGLTPFFARDPAGSEFSEAAFALAPGEISEVVESRHGFHVIRLEERREPRVQSLDEVREQIRNGLHNRERAAKVEELLTRLRAAAKVVPVVPPGAPGAS